MSDEVKLPVPDGPPADEKHWARDLRASFFAGLLVVVPLAASVGILLWLFNTFTGWLIPGALRAADGSVPFQYRVIALLVFVLLTISVGWVTRLVVGKEVVKFAESLVRRIPVLNKVYGFMKEVSDTMLSGQKTMFRRVVMVDLSGTGLYTLAFVTNEKEWEAHAKSGKNLVNVVLLASPPTHGYALSVPRERVVDMEMSVAEGMKLVISGGSVVPTHGEKPEGTA